jgi:SOS-response transcriptional repressor LexA
MNQMSGSDTHRFTTKQGQYLAFIDAYTRVHGRPPAEREMQRRFGVTPPSVHQMILTLEREGLIRRQPGVPRSIEVLVPPQDLPVLEAPNQPVKTSVTRY